MKSHMRLEILRVNGPFEGPRKTCIDGDELKGTKIFGKAGKTSSCKVDKRLKKYTS